MIVVKSTGSFDKTENFLKKMSKKQYLNSLETYAKEGVRALAAATPKRSGKTADSWDYEIVKEKDSVSIYWTNSNVNKGVPIAVIIQYGHGTRNGGYVKGVDYINPAMKPVFENIADKVWKEVTSS